MARILSSSSLSPGLSPANEGDLGVASCLGLCDTSSWVVSVTEICTGESGVSVASGSAGSAGESGNKA